MLTWKDVMGNGMCICLYVGIWVGYLNIGGIRKAEMGECVTEEDKQSFIPLKKIQIIIWILKRVKP